MGEDSGDKSEEPTPHKLREARQKGQIAKSKEITTAFLLIFTYVTLKFVGISSWNNLQEMLKTIYRSIPQATEFSLGFAGYILLVGVRGFIGTLAPIFAVVFFLALVIESLQTGFLFSIDPLSPKLERLNPMEGLKKLVSLTGIVELIKSILKIGIVFFMSWRVIMQNIPNIIVLVNSQPWDVILLAGNIVYTIAIRVGLFYIAIAVLDYFYKRWEYMKNLKMSKQEIKEEYKRLEGDPMIKQRMRELQRQASQARMMGAVPSADVVVTNPTHIAVAIQYTAPKMKSPLVLAKGERKTAEEIVKIADHHYIPIVENEPIARSIFRTTKIGQAIPGELYQAVAEILAYVYKIKKQRSEKKKSRLGPTVGTRGQKVN